MILDNLQQIIKLDTSRMRDSIAEVGPQCLQAWQETQRLRFTKNFKLRTKKSTGLVVCGMGGSGIGGHILKSLFGTKLKIPFEIINDYKLPGWVNKNTLVIVSSYSGTTEEALTAGQEAKHRGATCLAIAEGNLLEKWSQKNKIPFYKIIPSHNPSNQPRMALGYSIMGQLGLLSKCGLFDFSTKDLSSIIKTIFQVHQHCGPGIPLSHNPAKQLALKLKEKIPLLIGAEPLGGNLHTLRNQINENGKQNAFYLLLPELNHHAMEGLRFPTAQKKLLQPILIDSSCYLPRVQKRLLITAKVFEKNKLPPITIKLNTVTPLQQSFELLALGSWFSFYLAILHQINPAPVTWVDYFKKQLNKQ